MRRLFFIRNADALNAAGSGYDYTEAAFELIFLTLTEEDRALKSTVRLGGMERALWGLLGSLPSELDA